MYITGERCSNRCRIDPNGVKFFLYSKCRVGFETQSGRGGEGGREKQRGEGRGRTMYFYMAFPERKRGMDRSMVYGKWEEEKRKAKRKREELSRLRRMQRGNE